MGTPIRTDVRSLHRRLSLIIASQIAHLRKKQLAQKGFLDNDDVKQFKILADSLDDQIKLQRVLHADMRKDLDKLPDEKLTEIIAAAPEAGQTTPNVPAESAEPTKKGT